MQQYDINLSNGKGEKLVIQGGATKKSFIGRKKKTQKKVNAAQGELLKIDLLS